MITTLGPIVKGVAGLPPELIVGVTQPVFVSVEDVDGANLISADLP